MSYVTWANWADGWNDTAANWASQIYTASADLDSTLGNSNVGNIQYPLSASFSNTFNGLYSEDKDSPVYPTYQSYHGFQTSSVHKAVGSANLDGSYNKTTSTNLNIPGSVTLSNTSSMESAGGFAIPLSASFNNSLNQTLANSLILPANVTLNVSNSTTVSEVLKAVGSINLNNALTQTNTNTITFTESAAMLQAFLTELHEEDRVSTLYGVAAGSYGVNASCVLVLPTSGTLSSNANISSSSSAAFTSTVTLDNSLSQTNTSNVKFVSAALLSQTLGDLNEEDRVSIFSASLSGNYGIIVNGSLLMPSTASLDFVSNTVNNVNFEEIATISTNVSMEALQRLLWEDETEATTTWTEITEGSDTWTKI